jgi:hypothetical protein
MSVKILSSAIVAAPLLAFTAPAFAADPAVPATKADCEKGEGHEVGCHSQSVREEVTYLTSRLVK